jgi:hypothetical protein
MAEGDVFVDEDTGEEFVEAADGTIVMRAREDRVGQVQALQGGMASGALDTMLMGRGVTDLMAAGLDLIGADTGAEKLRGTSEKIQSLRDRVQPDVVKAQQQEHPLTFLGGEIIGGLKPGAPAAQGVMGVLEGVGIGQTPTQQAVGAGLGALGGVGGGRAGQRAAMRNARRLMQQQGEAGRARIAAINTLEEMGIPMREADVAAPGTAGHTVAATRDKLRQLLDPDEAMGRQREALNEIVTEQTLPGKGRNAITQDYMNELFDAVDSKYADIRGMLPKVISQSDSADTAGMRLISHGEEAVIEGRPQVQQFVNTIINDYDAGKLTPERWGQIRSRIAGTARDAHRRGDWEAAEDLYTTRELFDEMVHGGDQQVVEAMSEAADLFKMREVLDSANVVNGELNLNPRSFLRNMERMFQRPWRTGTSAPENVRTMHTAVSAAQQFPAFRTSGTGEMLTAGSLAKQLAAEARLMMGTRGQMIGGSLGRGAGARTGESDIVSDFAQMVPAEFGRDDIIAE